MKKNAFTLIELLAVIVILAIISLITTPIVSNIIKNSRKESLILSVQNYVKAIEIAVSSEKIKDKTQTINGIYSIKNKGKEIEKDGNTIKIDFNGREIKEGYIVIENFEVIKLSGVKIDEWDVKINNGVVSLTNEEEKISTLVTGQQFNEKIKTLVTGETIQYSTEDTIVKTIEFYSDGILPTGYTKETLQELPNVDVSLNGDIIAYNDNGKIYVCSENIISFNQNASYMFYRFKVVTDVKFIRIETSKTNNMQSLFTGCNILTTLDVSKWDTSNVTGMGSLFEGCKNLTTLDVSKWDTSKVTSMSKMFWGCNSLIELDVSKWDTSNVIWMDSLFQECKNLTNLDVSNFDTSKVTSMGRMFQTCSSLTELDVSNFDTSKVTNMTFMFSGCSGLTELNVSGFDTVKVTNMSYMFQSCRNLTTLDANDWNTSNVTTMQQMFYCCYNLTTLDLSNWNTEKVTNMNYMFGSTSNLKPIFVRTDFGLFATKNSMFSGSKTPGEEQLCYPNSILEWCTVN